MVLIICNVFILLNSTGPKFPWHTTPIAITMKKLFLFLTVSFVIGTFVIYQIFDINRVFHALSSSNEPVLFAVFACSTPTNSSHRGFDYAFYLPLTVLAWKRIGFESVVLLIGSQKEWKDHPALSLVLESLAELNAPVIFIDAEKNHRMMLSQTSRIFTANLAAYPGRDQDYLITSDADLWPLKRSHYVPRVNCSLVLVHSQCCGHFKHLNQSYRMLPMGNIGASAATWREINGAPADIKDQDAILNYLEKVFGSKVRDDVGFASDEWYYDQKLVSIRISEWIHRGTNQNFVFEVSDDGLSRIDRASWHPENIHLSSLGSYFDAHLILDGYLPEKWSTIRPLIHLMYNETSWQSNWCESYAEKFYSKLFSLEASNRVKNVL